MATLTPTLTLVSAAGQVSSDAMSVSVTDELSVTKDIIFFCYNSILSIKRYNNLI